MTRHARPRLEPLDDRRLPSFSPAATLSVGANPQDVVTADFNGDGKLDLATANAGAGTVSVRLGDGAGGFGDAIGSAAGYNPVSLAVGDFNEDGKLDLAAANGGGYGVSVLLGNGDGNFRAPASVGVGSDPLSVAVGDFNGDGKMDLAVSSQTEYTSYYYGYYYYGSTWRQGHVSVLLGDGGGGFAAPNTYDLTGGSPFGLAVADLDADGSPDVVTANEYGTASVLLGNGDGTLRYSGPASDFATGWYPQAVAVGDFTGDGILDLVTAGQTVDILPGFGDGTFRSVVRQYVDPVAVAAADFNGDGMLDVATADPWTAAVSVFLGRGDGTLTLPVEHTAGLSPVAVAVGDFNGDGRPDLVAANAGSDTVSVLLNDGVWPPRDAPSLRVGDVTVVEGNAGTVNAVFTVTLSAASDRDVTFRYATLGGTATAGTDYDARSGEVTIRAGATSATIVVPVRGDRAAESAESFSLRLSDPVNAFVADGLGVATIADDEPRISINNVTKYEGNGKTTVFTFTVSLSVAYDQPVTVSYATAAGTATAGTDYESGTGTVTFAPGETTKTISVVVKGDKQREANETFYVDLFGASSFATIGVARGVGTIWNDDNRA